MKKMPRAHAKNNVFISIYGGAEVSGPESLHASV